MNSLYYYVYRIFAYPLLKRDRGDPVCVQQQKKQRSEQQQLCKQYYNAKYFKKLLQRY